MVWWSYGESLRMDRAEEGQTHSTPWVPESCCPCTSLPQPSVILSPGQLMTSPLPTAPRGPCVLPSGPRWFSVLWLHLHAQPGGLSLGTRAVSAPRRVRLAIRWDHPHPGLVWSRKEPRLQHHRAQMLGDVSLWIFHTAQHREVRGVDLWKSEEKEEMTQSNLCCDDGLPSPWQVVLSASDP